MARRYARMPQIKIPHTRRVRGRAQVEKGRVRRKSEMQARPSATGTDTLGKGSCMRFKIVQLSVSRHIAAGHRIGATIKMAVFNVHRRAAARTKNKPARLFEFEAAPKQFLIVK